MTTTHKPTDLGSVLRYHRENLGRRPEEVTVALGRSAAAVMRWERNKSVPTLAQLHQLAGFYGVDISELVAAEVPSARAEGAAR